MTDRSSLRPTSSRVRRHGIQAALFLGLALLLSACVTTPPPATPTTEDKPLSSGRVLPVNGDLWTIGFRPDAESVEAGVVVTGEVLIRKSGEIVQSIVHSLDRDELRNGEDSWLQIEDVNNDGLPDLLLKHAPASSGASPVKSLFLFDTQSQLYVLQTQISRLGDIDKLSGCVVVTAQSKDKTPTRSYCFSKETAAWMELKRPTAASSTRCNAKNQKQAECRTLRTQRDDEMRRLVKNYIDGKSKIMLEEKRQTAAQRFARNLRVGHDQWLLYRDARCASYVIEHNFPVSKKGFEMESCKLDLSGLQLQHYVAMLALLDKESQAQPPL